MGTRNDAMNDATAAAAIKTIGDGETNKDGDGATSAIPTTTPAKQDIQPTNPLSGRLKDIARKAKNKVLNALTPKKTSQSQEVIELLDSSSEEEEEDQDEPQLPISTPSNRVPNNIDTAPRSADSHLSGISPDRSIASSTGGKKPQANEKVEKISRLKKVQEESEDSPVPKKKKSTKVAKTENEETESVQTRSSRRLASKK